MFRKNQRSPDIRANELKRNISKIEKEIDSHLFQEATAKILNAMSHVFSLGASLPGLVPHHDSSASAVLQKLNDQLEAAKTELISVERKMDQLSQKTNGFSHDAKDDMTLHVQLNSAYKN